jgi:hypothetical protein
MPSTRRTGEGGGVCRIAVNILHLSIFRREETLGIAGAVPIAETCSIKRYEKELNAVVSLRIDMPNLDKPEITNDQHHLILKFGQTNSKSQYSNLK